jgi:hypothetical protein
MVKKNILDAVEKKIDSGTAKSKQYLVVFTKTEDFRIIDATNGNTIIEK